MSGTETRDVVERARAAAENNRIWLERGYDTNKQPLDHVGKAKCVAQAQILDELADEITRLRSTSQAGGVPEGHARELLETALELFEMDDECNNPGTDAWAWTYHVREYLKETPAALASSPTRDELSNCGPNTFGADTDEDVTDWGDVAAERERASPISPYSERDDDKIAALLAARRHAKHDADAAAILWAEDEIATLRKERNEAINKLNALASSPPQAATETTEADPPHGCNFSAPWFGANYPDCYCVAGYLHDADDDGYVDSDTSEPCPCCNTREFLENRKEESDGTVTKSWGTPGGMVTVTGDEIWERAKRWARKANPKEADALITEFEAGFELVARGTDGGTNG